MVRVKDYKVIFLKKYIQKEYAFKKKNLKGRKQRTSINSSTLEPVLYLTDRLSKRPPRFVLKRTRATFLSLHRTLYCSLAPSGTITVTTNLQS